MCVQSTDGNEMCNYFFFVLQEKMLCKVLRGRGHILRPAPVIAMCLQNSSSNPIRSAKARATNAHVRNDMLMYFRV